MASPELVVSVQDASQAVRPASHPSNVRGFPKLTKQIALNVFEGLRVECGDIASVDALIERTAKLTQVSERPLYWWKTEMKDAGEVLPPKKRSCGKGRDRT
ncbi:hypothetical protein HPB50_021517 [Hyalomma asiaticum]|uniref:Uncharacterized protein n=1 Tax=Hyalomma asiaticum TaxID=266040 RepID=A0ACB7RKW0_HYAAI|nr:hypothetical protein HPB50_021517 [Hyalomma asiaticum]